MAEQQLIAKYQADLSALEAAVSKVQAVAADTQKAFEKSNRGIEQSAKKVENVFARLGESGRAQLAKIADTSRIQAGFAAMGAAGSKQLQLVASSAQGTATALATIPAKTEEAAKRALQPTINLKKALGDAGQGARTLGLLVGGVFGDMIFVIGQGLSAIKSFAASIVGFLGPGGVIVAGLAAAAAGGLYFAQTMERTGVEAEIAAEKVDKLKQRVEELTKAQADAVVNTRITSNNLETYERVLANINAQLERARQLNDPAAISQLSERSAVYTRIVAELRAELEKLNAAQEQAGNDLVAAKLDEIQGRLGEALRRTERELEITGDRVKYLTDRQDAYKKALSDSLDVEGASTAALKSLQDAVTALGAQVETAEKQFEDLKQAKEDALLPAGSFSPVDQPTGIIAGFAGPQKPLLPDVAEINSLVVALEAAQQQIQVTAQTVGQAIGDTFRTLAQGIGDAVAAAIVYGASLGEALLNVLKAVAAQVISTLVRLGVQAVINELLRNLLAVNRTAQELASYAAITYAAAFASTAAIPIVGPALAPGAAAAAVAAMLAGAAGAMAAGAATGSGVAAFAEGGLVLGPVLGLIGEAGPEVVLPLNNRVLEQLGGNGEITIHNYLTLDGKVAAKSVTKHQPGVLRRKLGPIF